MTAFSTGAVGSIWKPPILQQIPAGVRRRMSSGRIALRYDVNGTMTGALGRSGSTGERGRARPVCGVLKAASQVKMASIASAALVLLRPCTGVLVERALAISLQLNTACPVPWA
jgi:hypothetical protein